MAKKVENLQNNLQDSEKSSIFAASFVTAYNYTPIFESVNQEKNPNLVRHEALSIREILVRSSRGQRLDVHERYRSEGIPDDMYPESELERVNETVNDAPPDGINDIVDVYAYQEELARRKVALQERAKKNSKEKSKGSPAAKPAEDESAGVHNEGEETK